MLPARRRREELADLVPSSEAQSEPLLVVRLLPERFLSTEALLPLGFVMCDSLVDALTFLCAGYRNATTSVLPAKKSSGFKTQPS